MCGRCVHASSGWPSQAWCWQVDDRARTCAFCGSEHAGHRSLSACVLRNERYLVNAQEFSYGAYIDLKLESYPSLAEVKSLQAQRKVEESRSVDAANK